MRMSYTCQAKRAPRGLAGQRGRSGVPSDGRPVGACCGRQTVPRSRRPPAKKKGVIFFSRQLSEFTFPATIGVEGREAMETELRVSACSVALDAHPAGNVLSRELYRAWQVRDSHNMSIKPYASTGHWSP